MGVFGFGSALGVEESLLLVIGLDQRDQLFGAAAEAQVLQRLMIDGEDAASRSILGSHVGDGGAIGERQVVQSGAKVLDELADNAVLAEHLGDSEHQIGSGRTSLQAVAQAHADDLRDEHRYRLAEHGGFGFDSAHAPAEHAKSVDHRGMRIGSDQRVGIGERLAGFAVGSDEDHAREVLEVDLVHDAGVGRHDGEVLEGCLSPAQEGVTLLVAMELQVGVELQGLRGTKLVDLHRVIDNQLGRLQRIDQRWVSAKRLHRVAHGGEIDHGRHAGEILQQNAAGHEGDLLHRGALAVPRGQGADVIGLHCFAIFAAQQVFQQDAKGEWKVCDRASVLLESVETINFKFAIAGAEGGTAAETVHV